jgi:hypothetical protein
MHWRASILRGKNNDTKRRQFLHFFFLSVFGLLDMNVKKNPAYKLEITTLWFLAINSSIATTTPDSFDSSHLTLTPSVRSTGIVMRVLSLDKGLARSRVWRKIWLEMHLGDAVGWSGILSTNGESVAPMGRGGAETEDSRDLGLLQCAKGRGKAANEREIRV